MHAYLYRLQLLVWGTGWKLSSKQLACSSHNVGLMKTQTGGEKHTNTHNSWFPPSMRAHTPIHYITSHPLLHVPYTCTQYPKHFLFQTPRENTHSHEHTHNSFSNPLLNHEIKKYTQKINSTNISFESVVFPPSSLFSPCVIILLLFSCVPVGDFAWCIALRGFVGSPSTSCLRYCSVGRGGQCSEVKGHQTTSHTPLPSPSNRILQLTGQGPLH